VLMITHKFREVMAYADDVSVLRRGALVASHAVSEVTSDQLAAAMVGQAQARSAVAAGVQRTALQPAASHSAAALARLQVRGLCVMGDRGDRAVHNLSVQVRAGEIVGIAGVSGNGQRELMESLVGQRAIAAGEVVVSGEAFHATRAQNRRLRVRSLPEEPLRNACVADLSVGHNMGLRNFDIAPIATSGWMHWARLRERATRLIQDYSVKTQGDSAPMRSLSGGNVQRAVLARELADEADLLLVSNPVFGLDFGAVAEIHDRLITARNRGTAVLLVSEDLDELMQLSDRIVVMSGGRIVFECDARHDDPSALRFTLGAKMGGQHAGSDDHAHVITPELAQAA
jgi:general nucleoside transport system ATP-binding protein